MSEQKNNLPKRIKQLITELYDGANLSTKKKIDTLHTYLMADTFVNQDSQT